MKRNIKNICTIICMAVLLFAMTAAVVGCRQKEAGPSDVSDNPSTPSASGAAELTIPSVGEVIPTVDRQAELAEARAKNPDAVA